MKLNRKQCITLLNTLRQAQQRINDEVRSMIINGEAADVYTFRAAQDAIERYANLEVAAQQVNNAIAEGDYLA